MCIEHAKMLKEIIFTSHAHALYNSAIITMYTLCLYNYVTELYFKAYDKFRFV